MVVHLFGYFSPISSIQTNMVMKPAVILESLNKLLLTDQVRRFEVMKWNVFIQTTDNIEESHEIPGIQIQMSFQPILYFEWKRKTCEQIITQCVLRTNIKEKLICMGEQEQALHEIVFEQSSKIS